MKKIMIIVAFGLGIAVTACKGEKKEVQLSDETQTRTEEVSNESVGTISLIDAEQLKLLLEVNPDIQLVDVRTPEEVAEGRILQARHIPIAEESFMTNIQDLDKSRPVYVYCRSGRRSARAANILKENGFSEIYDLDGGIEAWTGAGYDTE